MTLHPRELARIGRIETEEDSRKYGICNFAFNECNDSQDPYIFTRFCDRKGNRCPSKAERIENNNLLN